MKQSIYSKMGLGLVLSFLSISCEDFLEIEAPEHKIASEIVFNNDEVALSAMTGIYHQLFETHFSNGWENSVTVLAGLSSDNLKSTRDRDFLLREFDDHQILPENTRNLALWSSAYNIIYMTNSLIEGVTNSTGMSEPVQKMLEGEAKFVRAFTYFYLVNLYAEVPLILTTDYRENSLAAQVDETSIYHQILLDLTDAADLLGNEYRDGERTHVNKFAVLGLLARVNLYMESWEEAERLASLVLNHTSTYELKENLDDVFLANSKEALWQISPKGGGNLLTHTKEGNTFIVSPISYTITKVGLTNDLVGIYEEEDQRLHDWIGYHDLSDIYYAFKYKDRNSMENLTEYSMVLRLAEQYLIRAEARARQDDVPGALTDINKVRERAGLTMLAETISPISQEELIEFIFEERRKEFFTEWGHRWLDLKRIGKTSIVLGTGNVLYPIPEEERIKNPNLNQNIGY